MGLKLTCLNLPVTRITGENPLPMFSSPAPRPVRADALSAADREGLGRDTGFRVLPYRLQDQYEDRCAARDVEALILSNEHLRAVFLPQWGGRLYSLTDLDRNRELLFRNPAIKLGNLALRDAWFSGGVEWNFGHYGHTCLTCENVFFAEGRDGAGNPFLRMYEFERMTRMVFQADFHLPPGARHLTCHLRVYNPHEAEGIFLWTNTAVRAQAGARAFSGTDEVLLLNQREGEDDAFLRCALPDPLGEGIDHSIPENVPYAEEYFFQNPRDARHAFEAFLYPDGDLFYERSTGNYPYRKVFLWGSHPGGRHWQEHLSIEGAGAYLEVQAGLARTQQHGFVLGAGETLCLTQMLGGARVEPEAFEGAYGAARAQMALEIERRLPPDQLLEAHDACLALAEKPAVRLLHGGSGWGALERRRDPHFLPAHLDFPDASLCADQAPWLRLLSGAPFEGADSFMTAPEWLPVLRDAYARQADSGALRTHLGIALYENGEREAAQALWRQEESPLNLRNLAYAAGQAGDWARAARLMELAIGRMKPLQRAYCEEYLTALNQSGQALRGYEWYKRLPQALRGGERLRLLAAVGACEADDEAFLDALFSHDFSVVREGEMGLHRLWQRAQARRLAKAQGAPLGAEHLERALREMPVPYRLDFRMKP